MPVPKDHLQKPARLAIQLGVGTTPRPGHIESAGFDPGEPGDRIVGRLAKLQWDHPERTPQLFGVLAS